MSHVADFKASSEIHRALWAGKAPTRTVSVNGRQLHLFVASTPDELTCGLSGRSQLGRDQGMAFVFPGHDQWTFWMKGTILPLEIAFLRDDGSIIEVRDLLPFSEESVTAQEPFQVAIEANAGWFRRAGVIPGDVVVL